LGKVIWSVGGKIDWNNIYGSNIGIDEVDVGQFSSPNHNVDFISGCCQLIRTSLINQIGLLDRNYFMYLEDADFCRRAINNNHQIAFVPQSIIWHINAGSSQAGGGALHDYFLTRNRLIFGLKYAGLKTKLALIKQSVFQLISSSSKWQKKAILDYYLNNLGKGSWV
jgi:GT2 family glycosyltransferase